jgi:hypothetical protein
MNNTKDDCSGKGLRIWLEIRVRTTMPGLYNTGSVHINGEMRREIQNPLISSQNPESFSRSIIFSSNTLHLLFTKYLVFIAHLCEIMLLGKAVNKCRGMNLGTNKEQFSWPNLTFSSNVMGGGGPAQWGK